MTHSAAANFVPFEPAPPPAPADPRLKVMPKAPTSENPPDFAPLQTPPGTSGAMTMPGPNSTPQPSIMPTVTLQRDGDRITGIRVECSCGQVIELACSY